MPREEALQDQKVIIDTIRQLCDEMDDRMNKAESVDLLEGDGEGEGDGDGDGERCFIKSQ